MTGKDRPTIRADIRLDRDVWMVTIFYDGGTEHRSFRNEIDAQAYARARVDQHRVKDREARVDSVPDRLK